MSNISKADMDASEDQFEASNAGQAFLRVATVTLIAIVAAALVLLTTLLILAR